jgi:hypothetical protein
MQRCTYLYFIPYIWFIVHTCVIFPVYARFLLAWDLQNRSVPALRRLRFINVQRLYKTIERAKTIEKFRIE